MRVCKKLRRLDCIKCNTEFFFDCTDFLFEKGKYKKYCSRKCANSHERSEESRLRTSKGMRSEKALAAYERRKGLPGKRKTFSKIYFAECLNCTNLFCAKTKKRKVCSQDCRIEFLIKNRVRYNYQRGKLHDGSVFDSSWEFKIAEFLDFHNIKWIRGKVLEYEGEDLKKHKYFPDFYLPKFDLYVEPKNKYLLEREKHKINYFKTRINFLYGHVDYILNKLQDSIPSV